MKKFKVVSQQDQSDCGVACLLTIVQYHGGTDTFDNLRKLSGTTAAGTTLLGLYQAAGAIGFGSTGYEADLPTLSGLKEPCILHVQTDNRLQHYVVCFGVFEKKGIPCFAIGDPAKGLVWMTGQELAGIWRSRICLTLAPNASFVRSSTVTSAKREWFLHLLKPDVPLLATAAGLGIGIAVLNLVMALFSQRLVDDILPKRHFTMLYLGIALVFVLLVVKEGFTYIRQHILLMQSKGFNSRLVDFFYRHLLQMPKLFFDTRKIGELTARLNDTARIQKVINQVAGAAVIDLIVVTVTTTVIFAYSWQAGAGCVVFMGLFYLLVYRHNSQISHGQRSIMQGYAVTEANYISTLLGIEPIKNFKKQTLFGNSNAIVYEGYQTAIFSLGHVQIRLSLMANCFAVLFLTGMISYTAGLVLNGHLKTGELIAILSLAATLLPATANLALLSIPLQEAKIAFERMFDFTGIGNKQQISAGCDVGFESLQTQHLAFRFPGKRQLLCDVSFEVHVGEIVAIMGENASGKSTLLQLLQKNYSPESGEILVNGRVRLGELGYDGWCGTIAVVPQNIHIFNGTILENIAFEEAGTNPGRIIRFVETGGFFPHIADLPDFLGTVVGEGGHSLSGGQKQMIALARALYHQPRLLLLDEATSAMDRESELLVLRLLARSKKDMATIFITHRLHVLRSFCDRIYIIEAGRTKASGTHTSLLQTRNLYSEYWNDLMQ